MQYSIKIQHRSAGSTPWRWEVFGDGRLITVSRDSFASQSDAHGFARAAVARLKADAANVMSTIELFSASAVFTPEGSESGVTGHSKEELYRRLAQARRMSNAVNDPITTERLRALIAELEKQLAAAETNATDAPPEMLL